MGRGYNEMDPVTHVLVGITIANFSGSSSSWLNPATVASIVGSLLPDADIVFQLGGDVLYLKHHRGFSHSLVGLSLLSVSAGLFLHQAYNFTPIHVLLLWTFLGCLSHLVIDVLNSYGAQILWPFKRRKFSCGLLTLFDPVITGLLLGGLWGSWLSVRSVSGLVLGYVGFRVVMREMVRTALKQAYAPGAKIAVFPSQLGLLCWDFIIETAEEQIVGYCRWLPRHWETRRRLKRQNENQVINLAKQTKLGQMFCSFSPFVHIFYTQSEDKHIVNFLDLRYFLKNDFMHSATVVFDASLELLDSILHPYHKNRQVRITD